MNVSRLTAVAEWAVRALTVVLVLSLSVLAGSKSLQRWMLGGGRGERALYIKLPLEQPRFHWFFNDESALLGGSLTIEIHGASGRDTVLTVFSNGRIAPTWKAMSRDRRGVYFGFIGGGQVWTEPKDSIVVRLEVAEDLAGIGAHRRGVLKKGEYRAVASYGHLTGHPSFGLSRTTREPMAYIGCWRTRWSLDVTEERGWRGAVSDENPRGDDDLMGRVENFAFGPRGTDGFRCVM